MSVWDTLYILKQYGGFWIDWYGLVILYLQCILFAARRAWTNCVIYSEVLFLSTVGPGTRWKFSAVCCVGVCHCRNGWGGTATDWWQVAGRDTHQSVLLCSWPSWKKHVGCSDCCPNNGIKKRWRVFACAKQPLRLPWLLCWLLIAFF